MDEIKSLVKDYFIGTDTDAVAVAVIDFSKKSFDHIEISENNINEDKGIIYFDLASLTKPLTNSFSYISEKLDEKELYLLMNHRAGLPSWGYLPRTTWRDQLNAYPIKDSTTVYSDYSALRYLLEFEKKTGKSLKDVASKHWDSELMFWQDLKADMKCVQNGYVGGKPNIGAVHDPNSFNLNCFTNHAGLFGTIDSVARTLLAFDKDFDFLNVVKAKILQEKSKYRFSLGFDRVESIDDTLAGSGCGTNSFGHLGFTGTSIWIDPDKRIGHIILTNATKHYWHDKHLLNKFRREIGAKVWKI